jgi:hypothetical protein
MGHVAGMYMYEFLRKPVVCFKLYVEIVLD